MKRYVCEADGKSADIVRGRRPRLGRPRGRARRPLPAGQTCAAGSSVLVRREVYEQFLRRYGEAIGRLRVGAPSTRVPTSGRCPRPWLWNGSRDMWTTVWLPALDPRRGTRAPGGSTVGGGACRPAVTGSST
ncbi:aldehyde dehydrogenase family protein [Streptomyces cyaneofuscatus]|uniref:aldehyde dehydrogenase family protein n=1 Tax=Streptomyces cyaneofuscatus TaxID=66883 RepID=UPI00365AD61B